MEYRIPDYDQHSFNFESVSYNDAQNGFQEDFEMAWDEPVETARADEITRYLIIDTNIFIDHLPIIRKIHSTLLECHTDLQLLIPCTVINELDGLKNAHRKISVQDAAREATIWLLHIHRLRKVTPSSGAIRIQRLSECIDRSLKKADDRILDCCLFFKDKSAGVSLWTQDRNLALLAESNDIPAIDIARPSPRAVLEWAQVDLSPKIIASLKAYMPPPTMTLIDEPKIKISEGDMELDVDLLTRRNQETLTDLFDNDEKPLTNHKIGQGSLLAQYYAANPQSVQEQQENVDMELDLVVDHTVQVLANHSTPTSISTNPSTPPSSRRSTLPPSSTILINTAKSTFSTRLERAFRPLQDRLQHIAPQDCSVSPNSSRSSISTTKIFEDMIDTLVNIELKISNSSTTRSGFSEDQIDLLQAITSLRTILRYIDTNMITTKERRPRTGEVSEALTTLRRVLQKLGLGDDEFLSQLEVLADEVRKF